MNETNAEYTSKDGKRRPVRGLYKHITGSIWMNWGTALDFKDKDKEVVILVGVNEDTLGVVLYAPLDTFWDKAPVGNPKEGQERFTLVTPNKE